MKNKPSKKPLKSFKKELKESGLEKWAANILTQDGKYYGSPIKCKSKTKKKVKVGIYKSKLDNAVKKLKKSGKKGAKAMKEMAKMQAKQNDAICKEALELAYLSGNISGSEYMRLLPVESMIMDDINKFNKIGDGKSINEQIEAEKKEMKQAERLIRKAAYLAIKEGSKIKEFNNCIFTLEHGEYNCLTKMHRFTISIKPDH